jgi:hypothetical protein
MTSTEAAVRRCGSGHPLVESNMYERPTGQVECRKCRRLAWLRGPTGPPRQFCSVGHRLAGWNVYLEAAGWRRCRICRRAEALRRYYRSKGRPPTVGVSLGV